MVLGALGYAVAQKGQNGFTCIVERAWMQSFGAPSFREIKMRAPICYNAAAARTALVYSFKRTEMVLAGASKSQIQDRIVAAIAAGAEAQLDVVHDVEVKVLKRRRERACISKAPLIIPTLRFRDRG